MLHFTFAHTNTHVQLAIVEKIPVFGTKCHKCRK